MKVTLISNKRSGINVWLDENSYNTHKIEKLIDTKG